MHNVNFGLPSLITVFPGMSFFPLHPKLFQSDNGNCKVPEEVVKVRSDK